MVWPVALPRKVFRLKVQVRMQQCLSRIYARFVHESYQVWDKDIAKYSDCLGYVELDLARFIKTAL
jgi:hypothetical protein